MTERTKIERVGGHLLIGESAIPIECMRAFSFSEADFVKCNIWSSEAADYAPIPARGWTAREVLEVAYDRDESAQLRAQYEIVQTQNAELRAKDATIRDLNATIDDLTRAGLEMERAKNEEIAVLREALRRVVDHLAVEASNGDGIAEEAVDDFITAKMLATCIERMPEAESRGLASIREAAGVER